MKFRILRTVITVLCFFTLSQVFSQDIIAGWTFPTGLPGDTLADLHTMPNISSAMGTGGGTGSIGFSSGYSTSAATVTGWDNGMDLKYWWVRVYTTDYSNIQLFSMQRAGGNNPGPRDFKVQYKLGNSGVWTDVPGGTVTVANDWSGALSGLALPSDCNNQADPVYFRWIMTSNFDWAGGTVASSGIGKIDEIYIKGDMTAGLQPTQHQQGMIFSPVPCQGILSIEFPEGKKEISLFDASGRIVYQDVTENDRLSVDLSQQQPGLYIIHIVLDGRTRETDKIILSR
ncbi:MAG: T9SS type A sorting domain-containing protein [Bacteroidetes bacterium]|nr:T9SS type A sorting domain-containing protein [Bacteroidota bacterium]